MTVAVYNDAGLSAAELARAEQKAASIFAAAGIGMVWTGCSRNTRGGADALARASEQNSPALASDGWAARTLVSRRLSSEDLTLAGIAGLRYTGRAVMPVPRLINGAECVRFDWPAHLEVRILSSARHAGNDTFGVAFLSEQGMGCYSNVFYGRARELHNNWNFPVADFVGNIMAHELGHLLLGSNAHASEGIMRARWQGEDLRQASNKDLWFTNAQAESIRRKLIAAQNPGFLQMTARGSPWP